MSLGHRYEAREQAVREHLAIIAALRDGDAQAAAEAMTRHIRQTAEAAVNLMFGIRRAAERRGRSRPEPSPPRPRGSGSRRKTKG